MQNAPELLEDATVTLLAAGTCLGPYRIESKLGEGGMGQVFRAVDTRLGRAIAVKITREQFSAWFEREARAISALNHPNICTLHDVGPNFLVMELVEGETLAARLKNGPLPIQTAILYGSQITAALLEAHGKGITTMAAEKPPKTARNEAAKRRSRKLPAPPTSSEIQLT